MRSRRKKSWLARVEAWVLLVLIDRLGLYNPLFIVYVFSHGAPYFNSIQAQSYIDIKNGKDEVFYKTLFLGHNFPYYTCVPNEPRLD